MPFPWMAAATIASTLLPMLFGGSGSRTQRTEQEVPPQGWQDPMLGLMSPLFADMMTRRMSSFGQGSSVYSPYTSQIFEMLKSQMPQLLTQAGGG